MSKEVIDEMKYAITYSHLISGKFVSAALKTCRRGHKLKSSRSCSELALPRSFSICLVSGSRVISGRGRRMSDSHTISSEITDITI